MSDAPSGFHPRPADESLDSAILRLLMETIPDRIYFKDLDSHFVRVNASHARFLGASGPDAVVGRSDADFFSAEHAGRALAGEREIIRTGIPMVGRVESITKRDGTRAWGSTTKMPWRDSTGRIIGTFGLTRDVTAAKVAEEKLAREHTLLQNVMAEMEADLRMARQLQQAFFSRSYPVFPAGAAPERSRLRFDHRYVPAATLGGDFFDISQLSDSRCGVLICDVMGHGVRAGLLTGLIRGAMDELGARASDPVHVLSEINRWLLPIVRQTGQPVFATAFYGVIDLDASSLTYANAGHPPAYLQRAGGSALERLGFDDPEPAAGLVDAFRFSAAQSDFSPGDRLVGYTDGIVEASDAEGRLFGEERLRAVLTDAADRPAAELLPRVVTAVESFTGRDTFEDDLCLVAVSRSQS